MKLSTPTSVLEAPSCGFIADDPVEFYENTEQEQVYANGAMHFWAFHLSLAASQFDLVRVAFEVKFGRLVPADLFPSKLHFHRFLSKAICTLLFFSLRTINPSFYEIELRSVDCTSTKIQSQLQLRLRFFQLRIRNYVLYSGILYLTRIWQGIIVMNS